MKKMLHAALLAATVAVGFVPSSSHAEDRLDVNTATREQLEALPGVGGRVASDIVRERDESGNFASLDDLARVASVTPAVLAKLKNLLKAGDAEEIVVQEGKVISKEVVRKVLMRFAGEPTVREVQDAAVAYSRVHPEIVDEWRMRARTNALAPRLDTQGQGTLNGDVRTVTQPGAATIESDTNSNGGRLTIGATWELDRLVFEPQEMAVAREGVRIANLRDRILDEATRRYYERRRLQVDLELSPPTELADRVRKELRLQELTADLDAVTGGWFSDKLEKAGRAAY